MANLTAEQLRKFVESIITQKLDKTQKFDNFFTGTILSVNNNVYDIQLSDNAEVAIKALPLKEEFYSKDDAVYVAKIVNGLTDSYLILDKVKDLQEEFVNLTLAERFLTGDQDPFILGDLNEDGRVLGDEDSEKEFVNIIKANGAFKITAIFSSNATTISGGLQIDLEVDDEENPVLKSYYLLAEDLVGRPQEMTNLAQEKVFLIEEEDLKEAFTKIRFKKCGNINSFICTDIKLISGSLIDIDAVIQVKTKIDNDKNYFSKEVPAGHENNVKVFSSVYYDGELLTLENQVQYYWLVKNDSVTSESPWYLSLAGDGWACLNKSEEADFIGVELATYPNGKIKVWDNKNNFIILNDTIFFPNYENILKCFIRYGDNLVSSEEFKIYNYARESFNAEIDCEEPAEILFSNSNFALICSITNSNKKIKNENYEFVYTWERRKDDNSWETIAGAAEKTIYIYDREKVGAIPEGENGFNYVKIQANEEGNEIFRCKVDIYKGRKNLGGTLVSTEYTEEKMVLSRVSLDVVIDSKTEYKYYLSKNPSVGFEKNQVDNEWTGDWDIVETGAKWIAANNYETVFSDMSIFDAFNGNKDCIYVYYTQRDIWSQRQAYQNVSEGIQIKVDHWDYPILARQVGYVSGELKNLKDGYSIDQLNTFNQITQGGKKQGVYHTEIGDEVPEGTDPDVSKKYYKRIRIADGFDYIPIVLDIVWNFKLNKEYYIKNKEKYDLINQTATKVDNEVDYYEQVKDVDEEGNTVIKYKKLEKNNSNFDLGSANWPEGEIGPFYTNVEEKLFINADYIQTGTLRVAGERDGKEIEKFYASIDKEDVRIGGYTVNETELTSGNVGISSDDSNANNLAFWAGAENENKKRPFEVTHAGVLTAEDANISGNITAKSLTISEDAEINGKIDANNIYAKELSSISANMGTVEAGIIQSKDYKKIVIWGEGTNSSEGLVYTYLEGTDSYEVKGIGACEDTDIIIPETHEGKAVTIIGNNAFKNCTGLTSVTIPASVISIGSSAFYQCSSLTSIIIPNSVTSIGEKSFQSCRSLTSIIIPNSVTSIGNSAFWNCNNLISIVIGENSKLETIGDNAFATCINLTSIIIPNSVTSIGRDAFLRCDRLIIYCKSSEKPDDWHSNWNPSNRPVYWYSENKPTETGDYWHYYNNDSGLKINLDNATLDSPNFKIDSDGSATFNGTISGSIIQSTNYEDSFDAQEINKRISKYHFDSVKSIGTTGSFFETHTETWRCVCSYTIITDFVLEKKIDFDDLTISINKIEGKELLGYADNYTVDSLTINKIESTEYTDKIKITFSFNATQSEEALDATNIPSKVGFSINIKNVKYFKSLSGLIIDGEQEYIKSKNFAITPNGDVSMTGMINAISGNISGYKINGTSIVSGGVGINSDKTPGAYAFWSGDTNASQAPFSVTNEGVINATKGVVGAFTMDETTLYTPSTFKDITTTNQIGIRIGMWDPSEDSDGSHYGPRVLLRNNEYQLEATAKGINIIKGKVNEDRNIVRLTDSGFYFANQNSNGETTKSWATSSDITEVPLASGDKLIFKHGVLVEFKKR